MSYSVALALILLPTAGRSGQPGSATYKTRWYLSDHLGTGLVVLQGNGDAVARRGFAPFGSVLSESPDPPTEATATVFSGQDFEEVTGLYDFEERWYDPDAGRFLSADPVIADLFDPQTVNAYSYVKNDPLNRVDPTGEMDLPVFDELGNLVDVGLLPPFPEIEVLASDFLSDPASLEPALGSEINDSFYQGEITAAEPAARLFGVIELGSTTPASDALFPNRGPLHFLVGAYEDFLVRALSRQLEQGEVLSAVIPGGPPVRLGVKAAARALASKVGANSVRFRTPGTVGRIDLVGRSHFDKATGARIPTPHVTIMERRVGPTGIQFGVPKTGVTRPATMQDIRNAQRLSE